MKKIGFYAAAIMAGLLAFSCATTTNSATTTTQVASENLEVVPNETNVKYLGRTYVKNDVLYFTQTASGVEFKVDGTKSLTLNLVGDVTARATRGGMATNYARYTVYVDGTEVVTGSMDKKNVSIEVFKESSPKTATIRVIKITEAAQSNLGLKNIVVDSGAKISATPEKPFKIEFIGDSITCGYGVEDTDGGAFTTQTENAAKAYGYLTAQQLDADYSIVSYSGFGIYSGFTSGDRNETALVPTNYQYITYTWSDTSFNSKPWDFSKFQPNVVVINLGTNDASYCKTPSLKADFEDAYVDFLKDIRTKNPKAYIICALGTMGQNLFTNIETAVNIYTDETKDSKVSTYKFPVQNTSADGVGADWHPSVATQKKSADMMTNYIKTLISNGEIN